MTLQRRFKLATGWALPWFAAAVAHAQAVPNIGDALRQVPSAAPQEKAAPALPRMGGAEYEPPMSRLPGIGPSVVVRRIELVGNREIGTETLLSQVAGDLGRAFTLPELEAMASKLTRYYRSVGYFVARVYVPEQEVVDGVLKLRAVEGYYGRFLLDNKSLVRDDMVQAMLDDVKKYDVVSLDTLERAMLIINDTPGAKIVRADVMPGTKIGTSDFAVGAEATREHEGYVLIDNHGTRGTGRERVSGNWDWNSPTRRGDRLSVFGLASLNGGLANGRADYGMSLSPSGLRGHAALAHTQYSLGANFAALDAHGEADSVELGVSYPLRRIRSQTVQIGLTYAHKSLRDEIRSTGISTPKRSDSLAATLSVRDEGRLWGADGTTQAQLSLTAGRLDIRDDAARLIDAADGGPRTNGGYGVLSASVGRVSLLPGDFSFSATLKLQQALRRNLDGSERMGLGGAGGVMAYPSGELSGSDAQQVRLELSRPLPALANANWQHQWSLLADWGRARETDLQPYRTLSDVALGYVARQGSGLLLKAYLAHRLESLPAQSEPTPRSKLSVQAGWIF